MTRRDCLKKLLVLAAVPVIGVSRQQATAADCRDCGEWKYISNKTIKGGSITYKNVILVNCHVVVDYFEADRCELVNSRLFAKDCKINNCTLQGKSSLSACCAA